MTAGERPPIYKFDHNVLLDSDVSIDAHRVDIAGRAVSLDLESPFDDMS